MQTDCTNATSKDMEHMLHAGAHWIADKLVHVASALHFIDATIDCDVSRCCRCEFIPINIVW